jgi:hypothetical protein
MQKLHIAEVRPQKKGGGGLGIKVSSLPGSGFSILKHIRPTEGKGNQPNRCPRFTPGEPAMPFFKSERGIIIPSHPRKVISVIGIVFRFTADVRIALATKNPICDFLMHRLAELVDALQGEV